MKRKFCWLQNLVAELPCLVLSAETTHFGHFPPHPRDFEFDHLVYASVALFEADRLLQDNKELLGSLVQSYKQQGRSPAVQYCMKWGYNNSQAMVVGRIYDHLVPDGCTKTWFPLNAVHVYRVLVGEFCACLCLLAAYGSVTHNTHT